MLTCIQIYNLKQCFECNFEGNLYLASIIHVPDSLTCRPDVGRRSALIGRYGRHQADVGSISGQVGHICRYGRHQADVGRRSALIGQKIGSYLPYLPIWPTSGRRRQHIGTNQPYLRVNRRYGRH